MTQPVRPCLCIPQACALCLGMCAVQWGHTRGPQPCNGIIHIVAKVSYHRLAASSSSCSKVTISTTAAVAAHLAGPDPDPHLFSAAAMNAPAHHHTIIGTGGRQLTPGPAPQPPAQQVLLGIPPAAGGTTGAWRGSCGPLAAPTAPPAARQLRGSAPGRGA